MLECFGECYNDSCNKCKYCIDRIECLCSYTNEPSMAIMTEYEKKMNMHDNYITRAIAAYRKGDIDMMHFYRKAAEGIKKSCLEMIA